MKLSATHEENVTTEIELHEDSVVIEQGLDIVEGAEPSETVVLSHEQLQEIMEEVGDE